jgi:hypothetical protein
MKIDWTEFKKGFDQEQVKEGAAGGKLVGEILDGVKNTGSRIWETIKPLIGRKGGVPAPAPHVPKPHVPAPDVPVNPSKGVNPIKPAVAAGTVFAGKGVIEEGKNKLNELASLVGNTLGAAPGLLSSLFSGQGRMPQAGSAPGYVLPPQRGGVSSWKNPLTVYNSNQPFFKRAGIMDDVTDAARKRVVNSVLNEVTKTNPLGVDSPRQQPIPHNTEKEIQLVSEYPEIKEMLKNEENKAYLERLLKEQA